MNEVNPDFDTVRGALLRQLTRVEHRDRHPSRPQTVYMLKTRGMAITQLEMAELVAMKLSGELQDDGDWLATAFVLP